MIGEEAGTQRHLPWDACYNTRDLGGYPTESGGQIRVGALLRSDNLCRLTPAGQQQLRDYGVRTIIDVRSPYELDKDPNPFAAQQGRDAVPRYINLPLLDEADEEGKAAMKSAGSMQGEYTVILDRYRARMVAIIKAVAAAEGEGEGGVLVHCHAGKDRTGMVVALLLSLAGVPRSIIADDYAASNLYLQPIYDAWISAQPRTEEEIVRFGGWFFQQPDTMLGVLDYLDRQYGGVEAYLLGAGVTVEEIAAIRGRLRAPRGSDVRN